MESFSLQKTPAGTKEYVEYKFDYIMGGAGDIYVGGLKFIYEVKVMLKSVIYC